MRQRLVLGVPLPVAILSAAFATLIGGCDGGANTEFYELSGEITDERSMAPIEGARVVFSADTGYMAETTTDGGGIYRLAIETDHPFGQVRAEAAGYVPNERTVYFDSEDRRIDLQLRPGTSM